MTDTGLLTYWQEETTLRDGMGKEYFIRSNMLLKYLRSSRCPFYSRVCVRNIRENFAMTGDLLFRHFDILRAVLTELIIEDHRQSPIIHVRSEFVDHSAMPDPLSAHCLSHIVPRVWEIEKRRWMKRVKKIRDGSPARPAARIPT